MLYELILINEIEQRAKIIFLSVWWEGQKGSYSIGTYVWLKAAYHLNSNGANK